MVTKICAYCSDALDPNARHDEETDDLSHGICRTCMESFLESARDTLDDLLEEIEVPVFVVDDQGLVCGANLRALTMVGKTLDEICGRLGGDVFGCAYADDPGGCGRTVHCRTCTIRNTVMETHATGEPQYCVPAIQDLDAAAGIMKVRFHITTEKSQGVVLLCVEDAVSVGDAVVTT